MMSETKIHRDAINFPRVINAYLGKNLNTAHVV